MSELGAERVAVLKVIAATVLWGICYPMWKLLALHFPPLFLTLLSFSLSAFMTFFVFRLDPSRLQLEFRRNAALLLMLALSGGALGTGLIFYALAHIDSGIAATLEKLQPVFTLVCARIWLQECIPPGRAHYMLFALVLSYAIAVPDPFAPALSDASTLGILAAIGAAFFYGLNTVVCRFLVTDGIRPAELAFFRMGVGATLLLPSLLFYDTAALLAAPPWHIWPLLVLAVALSLVWAFDLFLSGLQKVSAGVATFLELLTPVVALLLGVLLLSEQLSRTQAFAVPVFLFCLYRISAQPRSKRLGRLLQP